MKEFPTKGWKKTTFHDFLQHLNICTFFQQDNAPAHRARDMVELLRQETLAFIPPDI